MATEVTIQQLLEQVVQVDASDLHLQVGLPPMLRVDGALKPVVDPVVLTAETLEALIMPTLDDEQKTILARDKEIDYSFAYGTAGRFRVNAFHERGNLAAALRLIPTTIRTIDDLGLPKILNKFT